MRHSSQLRLERIMPPAGQRSSLAAQIVSRQLHHTKTPPPCLQKTAANAWTPAHGFQTLAYMPQEAADSRVAARPSGFPRMCSLCLPVSSAREENMLDYLLPLPMACEVGRRRVSRLASASAPQWRKARQTRSEGSLVC